MSPLARLSGSCDGNSAVEFALVAPVLLALVFGIFVYGLYFSLWTSLQQLAGEAARASVAGITEQERGDLARRTIMSSLASYGMLRPDSLTVQAGFAPSDPNLFTVSLTYDASGLGLGAFAALLPTPPDRLASSATVRRGGS